MKAKILLINLIFSALLSSCSYWEGVFKEPDPTIGMSAAQIYGEGRAFLDAEDYQMPSYILIYWKLDTHLGYIQLNQCLIYHMHHISQI